MIRSHKDKGIKIEDIDDFDVEFKKVDIEGNQINYVDEGQGDIILMVHGNPTWSYLYRHLIDDLKKDYRCVAPDLLGFGLSDKPADGDYSMRAHIRRLGVFIEKLGLNGITLVCQDWGGITSLNYASTHKERFRGLIPMNTAGFFPEGLEFLRVGRGIFGMLYLWSYKVPWVGYKAGTDWNWFVKLGLTIGIHRKLSERDWNGYYYPLQGPGSRIAVIKSVRQVPIPFTSHPTIEILKETGKELAGWDIPCRIIWGTLDPVFSKWFIRKFEELLPNHRDTVEIPTAGHFLQDDEPEIIIKAIRGFCK